MTDDERKGYTAGRRAAFGALLTMAAGELGIDTVEGKLAAALAELEATRRALREVCSTHGDADWTDDLYLPDVVEKHLARYLDEAF